jgi:membrane-bound lytic murein transglycosylase B
MNDARGTAGKPRGVALLRSFLVASGIFVLVLLPWVEVLGEEPAALTAQKESLLQKLLTKGFTESDVRTVFDDVRVAVYPEILHKKGKGIDYFNRKFGLLAANSIQRGQRVITENLSDLTRIENSFGIEKEVPVAIYRMETNFGRYAGNYRVFNSLLTLTVIENRRSEWAERELIDLMVLSKWLGFDPLSIKGSWAGAFGLCQFVPSSYLTYGIDGNNDGRVDLFNVVDALASVANYLKCNGWEKGNKEKKKKALYAYNHCDNYVEAVLTYANVIHR